ncbi:MAG: bifunctional 5,10-methylenetetrahydrofolate dehydrogenase/5,10-methenyltetrahydrofolate cyclohydrolase [Candidatus Buchananbacteria bacterium]
MIKQAKILDGKLLAEKIRQELKQKIALLPTPPGLAAILVGDDEASKLYIKLKAKACEEVGILFCPYLLPATTTAKEVINVIQWLNQDYQINGILVQLPLPGSLDEEKIINEIVPIKEVDGFGKKNLIVLKKDQEIIVPGLAAAINDLIIASGESVVGYQALIVAKSKEFVQAVTKILTRQSIIVHSILPSDKRISQVMLTADIIITAVGKKNFIKPSMIKPGVIIIDVGIIKKGKAVFGDVAGGCWQKAGFISPVPGGVGPLTVANLLVNTYQLYLKQK